MNLRSAVALLAAAICTAPCLAGPESLPAPAYGADGKLPMPADYRQWTFLTSSLDMSYNRTGEPDMHLFDNVFVQPQAYRSFLDSGTWPEHTVLVKEVRGASTRGSINRRGKFQTPQLVELEIHVKDEARFADGGWGFFVSDGAAPAQQIPPQADCYACHRAHGAVDNTFVQFYPTLIDLARSKNTLSAGFRKDEAADAK
ncbi:MAG TPA: cytochrome P460 family protein [Nevskia sp.]|nr:cytochrome P460 family protein [Nevskia sp.]